MFKRPLRIASILGALILAAGIAPLPAQDTLDKTIRVNIGGEPPSIDPSIMNDLGANNEMQALMEGLVRLDGNSKPHPAAAESWEHNADFTVWTFKLRKNAKWHNGDPVTANDFVYSVQRTLTPETTAGYAEIMYRLLKGGEDYFKAGGMTKGATLPGVRAIDDYTVEYTLNYPAPFFGTFISWGSWFPQNRKAVEASPLRWTLSPTTFVGNGPFRMTDYKAKDRLDSTKSETYWDKDAIFWEKVVFRFIDDDNTEDAAFRTGELDVTETLAVPQVNYWKGKPEMRQSPSLGTIYVQFNVNEAPFDNKFVRRAFSKALQRSIITDKLLRRGETPSKGFIPPGIPDATGTTDFRTKAGDLIGAFDPAAAKKILAEGGVTGPVTGAEYLYNTREENKMIAEQLQQMWRRGLGADVKIQNADWDVVVTRTKNNDFLSARGSWFGDYMDPLGYLELFQSTNPRNSPRFKNPKYDQLVESARYEKDSVKREQFFIEAEKLLVEDEAVIAPLYTNAFAYLAQANIEGLGTNLMGQKLFVRAKRVKK
ncbi:peptide ABC transporter substrate-binding protein [Candidatus Sumerlaeota bacterium]|nr:peptide ABC transporter substrate-binding protein [Candidatus Sumerlaeota bacterium]